MRYVEDALYEGLVPFVWDETSPVYVWDCGGGCGALAKFRSGGLAEERAVLRGLRRELLEARAEMAHE